MKRTVSCLLAVLLAISISAHAYGVELILKEQIHQEKGQIELNGLKLSIDDNDEIVIGGNDISARRLLSSEIENSKALKECLKVSLLKGETPKAIGYTIIYLKEAADDSGCHYEPMTIQEAAAIKATGPASSRGNLRLYTYAAGLSNNRIVARSVAQWTTDWQLFASERPAAGNDYI